VGWVGWSNHSFQADILARRCHFYKVDLWPLDIAYPSNVIVLCSAGMSKRLMGLSLGREYSPSYTWACLSVNVTACSLNLCYVKNETQTLLGLDLLSLQSQFVTGNIRVLIRSLVAARLRERESCLIGACTSKCKRWPLWLHLICRVTSEWWIWLTT